MRKKTLVPLILLIGYVLAEFAADPSNIDTIRNIFGIQSDVQKKPGRLKLSELKKNNLNLNRGRRSDNTLYARMVNWWNCSDIDEIFWRNPAFHDVRALKSLPIIEHDMSEEIHQNIVSDVERRMNLKNNFPANSDTGANTFNSNDNIQNFAANDYDTLLACEYVDKFFDCCCEPVTTYDSRCVYDHGNKEKIESYPLKSQWELTGAMLKIARSEVGRKLLLSLMTFYKKNPATPKIIFYLGQNGGIFGSQTYSGNLCYGIVIPLYSPLEAVYDTSNGNIDYIYSPRSAVIFHEMVHLIHKIEDSAMLVRRYVSLDVAAQIFSTRDYYGQRVVKRRMNSSSFLVGNALYVKKEYKDESWKTIKIDFCRDDRLLNELRAEFTDDEEFYTIFGFFKDKDGQIKRDFLCESAFTSEQYGYVRCGHWGPGNTKDVCCFNMMVNYGIAELYKNSDDGIQSNILDQEIEEEKEWSSERQNHN